MSKVKRYSPLIQRWKFQSPSQILMFLITKILPISSKRRRLAKTLLLRLNELFRDRSFKGITKILFQYIHKGLSNIGDQTKQSGRMILFHFNLGSKLVFPRYNDPYVVIFLRVGASKLILHKCLQAILACSNVPYQLVAIGKTDVVVPKNFLALHENITVVKDDENWRNNIEIYGLLRSQNMNVKYIFFITDEILVTNGYMEQMIRVIESDERCGAVGCKIIDRNGYLLDAGGIIWDDESTSTYGIGGNPDDPEYSFVRSVHYVSMNCILVRKDILDQYFTANQDSGSRFDLSEFITKLGFKIKYQPDSVAIHQIAEQNKPDKISTIKTLQRTMRNYDYLIARSSKQAAKILVLDDYIPAIRYGSGFPRLYEMLVCLADLGYLVTFLPVGNPIKVQPETQELQQKGIEIFWDHYANLDRLVRERERFYDVVLISRPNVFEKIAPVVENLFSSATIIYDAEALFYTRELLKYELSGAKMPSEQSSKMIHTEMKLIEAADLVISVSEKTKDIMQENSSQKNIEVWEHIQEINPVSPSFETRNGIVFLGSFFAGAGSPNEDAALFFALEVYPLIRKNLVCELYIVGTNPTPAVRRLAGPDIKVTGFVENPATYFNSCRVNVVPTRFAAGIPLKLIDAMGNGIPSVVSSLIADQLNLSTDQHVLIAKNANEFAEKVIDLYSNKDMWCKIQTNSQKYVQENFSRNSMMQKLNLIIEKGLKIRDVKRKM